MKELEKKRDRNMGEREKDMSVRMWVFWGLVIKGEQGKRMGVSGGGSLFCWFSELCWWLCNSEVFVCVHNRGGCVGVCVIVMSKLGFLL